MSLIGLVLCFAVLFFIWNRCWPSLLTLIVASGHSIGAILLGGAVWRLSWLAMCSCRQNGRRRGMMTDEAIIDLLREAPISFVGTIEQLGAATMDVPIDDRTAVVYVARVLHGPDALLGIGGQRITLQLAADVNPPEVGDTATFFARALAFGAASPLLRWVASHSKTSNPRCGEPRRLGRHRSPHSYVGRDTSLCKHADQSDAVVLGRVVKLEIASSMR